MSSLPLLLTHDIIHSVHAVVWWIDQRPTMALERISLVLVSSGVCSEWGGVSLVGVVQCSVTCGTIDIARPVGPSAAAVRQQYSSLLEATSTAPLQVKQSKCTKATSAAVTVLGVDICGAQRAIVLSIERHCSHYCRPPHSATPLCPQPARVLGAWTWQVLKHSYRFVERYINHPPRPVWPSVARELSVLTAL